MLRGWMTGELKMWGGKCSTKVDFYTQPRGASADNGVREPTMTLTGVAVRLSSAFSIQTTKLGHGWWSGTWTKRGSGRKQLLAYMRVLS